MQKYDHKLLKHYRNEAGLTIFDVMMKMRDLGAPAHKATIENWEKGMTAPSAHIHLPVLAKIYGVRVENFYQVKK